MNQLQNERFKVIDDAVRMKKSGRVAFVTNDAFWRYHDCGKILSKSIFNYKVIEEVLVEFQKRYDFDAHLDIGDRNPLQVTTLLGNKEYIIDDVNNTLMINEQNFFTADDYDSFSANPLETIWNNILPKKYPPFRTSLKFSKLASAFKAFGDFAAAMKKIEGRLNSEFGVLPLKASVNDQFAPGIELLYNFFRGMVGLSRDLRRYPEKVEKFCDDMFYSNIKMMQEMKHIDTNASAFNYTAPLLSQNMLNPKQFEKYYWKYLKQFADKVVETDNTMFVLSEGTTFHISEYLQDIPKGHFCFYVETDDIFEARKRYPNLCLWGGLPLDLISKGTPQQCIDHAKKVIDEVGRDGGLLLCTNKFTANPNDCKRENLLAVSEFVHKYK